MMTNKKLLNLHCPDILSITGYAALFTILFIIIFGVVSVVIPNRFFARMIPISFLDYLFLILTSLLLGTYMSLHIYHKNNNIACDVYVTTGWFASYLGFGCSFCNKILIFMLGIAGVANYIEPYKYIISSFGILIMALALIHKLRLMHNLFKLNL